jgi:hypothetical protein
MTMTRKDKIARIVAVQTQMHRLEEWKLVALKRREDELHDEERSLIGSLNAGEPLHGLFVDAMAKRLTAIGKRADAVTKAKKVQTEIVMSEARKLKQAERMEVAATTVAQREGEKRQLEDTIGDAVLRLLVRGGADRFGN